MEEKATPRTKRDNGEAWWLHLLLDGVLGSLQSLVTGLLESAEEAVSALARRLAHQVFVLALALLGLAFLFFGLARSLDTWLRFPGAGETIVGGCLLLIGLGVATFHRDRHRN